MRSDAGDRRRLFNMTSTCTTRRVQCASAQSRRSTSPDARVADTHQLLRRSSVLRMRTGSESPLLAIVKHARMPLSLLDRRSSGRASGSIRRSTSRSTKVPAVRARPGQRMRCRRREPAVRAGRSRPLLQSSAMFSNARTVPQGSRAAPSGPAHLPCLTQHVHEAHVLHRRAPSGKEPR